MRLPPLLCLAFLAMSGGLMGETTLAVDRNPPPVFARSIAGLLTRYDDVQAGKTAFPSGDHDEIVLVSETIHFRDADGTRYWARHQIFHAVGDSAVERLGNSVYTFDRERESIFLIDAATILPDGRRQPVTEKGAFIQTPQHEAESSLYTSRAELNLVFPNVSPGATTEATVLIRENVPVMPAEYCADFSFYAGRPTFLRRFVVDLPNTDWPRVRALTSGSAIAEPLVEEAGAGRTRKTWSQRLIPMSLWEEGSPSFEFRAPTLWLTTLDSWDDIARWFHRLASERSELGPELTAEVNKLTAGLTDPHQIVDKLCSVVANEVRYTGLEFGLAGYQPAACRDVWARRYGDCKDKANLLRAMIAQKGIRSHLVLLNTATPARVERGSPSWDQFNHAILAVEDGPGRYRFCDPTVKYLPAGVLGLGDRARDVLIVNDGHAEWVRTEDVLDTAVRVTADLKFGADGELSGWYTFTADGSTAAFYADHFNGLDKDARRRSVQEYVEEFVPGASVVDIDYQPANGSVSRIQLRAFLRRQPRGDRGETMNFPYPAGWLPDLNTAGERRFAYGGTAHREEAVDFRITLPEDWSAGALPAAFKAASEAADFAASWVVKDAVLEAQLRWAPRKAEIPPGQYAVLQRSVRALKAWLAQPVLVAPNIGQPAAAAAAAAPAQNLDGFPILPTGEGQLRLLEEKFPAGRDDERRRAALEQVLQWFPNDAETVFTAQVNLAQLDHDRLGHRAFADKIAALLASYGNQVSLAARAWGEYIEALAAWQADKSRPALKHLRRMAADTSIPLFRRGWAAYQAARCLAESDPGAAADFLLPYCELETEAQDDSECLVAIYRAQTADNKNLARFLEQLPGRHRADPVAIMEKVFGAVAEHWTEFTPAARTTTLAVFGRALVPAERFPKASDTLANLHRDAEAEAARRHFTEELTRWLKAHPTKLWSEKPTRQYPDASAAIKAIEAANKANDPATLVEATLQLVAHHQPTFAALAKYTDWTIWWLGKDHLADDLFEELGALSLQLPAETSEDVVECWADYSGALAKRNETRRAGEIMEKILNAPAAKPYQKVAAGGELGQMALRAGDVGRALEWFRTIEPTHATNKLGVDYLYTALLVELERGNFDRGLEIVARIREQQPKFIKEAANSPALEPLLRAAEKPEALKRYWQRRARWRPQWDQLLTAAGLAPAPLHEPPVKIDWGARDERIAKAVADHDVNAYLHLLDEAARVAQWLPAAVINVQNNVSDCDPFPAEFRRSLRECALAMVADWVPVDPQVDDDAMMWEALVALNLERKTEAGTKARALYSRIGADKNAGETALRVWVIASRGSTEEPEAIAALTRLCDQDRALNNRTNSVRVLSDSLLGRGDAMVNLKFLERETARTEFSRTSADGKALLARLDDLRQQHAAAGALTKIVSEWKGQYCHEWFEQVGPASLDDPRCAGMKEPMTDSKAGFAEAERVKFNLLFALDERQETEARETAFSEAVVPVAQATHDLERFTAILLECAHNQKLGMTTRRKLLGWVLFTAAEYRRPDLLARVLREEAFATCTTEVRDSAAVVSEALKMSGDKPDAEAFRLLIRSPIDYLRCYLADRLLCELAASGQAALAGDLLASAGTLTLTSTFDQTPAGVRLQWTRSIRTAAELSPLLQKLRTMLASIPAATGATDKRISDRLHSVARADLTAAEDAAIGAMRLRSPGAGTPVEIEAALFALRPAVAEQILPADFGADVFETVLGLQLDDAVKAPILSSADSLFDVDVPDVCNRVDSLAKAFLSSPEATKQPETVRVLAGIRAWIALRTSKEDRPDPLFGSLVVSKVPERKLRLLQLQFHHSRGNWPECDSIVGALDPEDVKSPAIFAIAKASLERNQRTSEIPVFVEAAEESTRKDLASMWFDPADQRASHTPYGFVELGGLDHLIPDSWYELALAKCRNALFHAELRHLRARTHGNWDEALRACDDLLKLSPTTYSFTFYRAEAHRALGHDDDARKDLAAFLAHALDDIHYQTAVQMQKNLGSGPAKIAAP